MFSGGSAVVYNTTSWKVTQRGAGANMSVDIAAGSGFLLASSFPYAPWSDATVNKTVTTADPSNPRRDIVVAYLDMAVPSTGTTNAVGALKFMVVAGTPGASPSDPNSSAIQSAVGAGNPWVYLGRIRIGTPGAYVAPTSVVDGMIDDLRQPISFRGRLWGGSNNTNGHLVPNVADGTMIVSTDTGTIPAALLSTSAITLGSAQITSDSAALSNNSAVSGLSSSVTIPAGGRKIRITAFGKGVVGSNANGSYGLSLWDGTVGVGTQLASSEPTAHTNNGVVPAFVQTIVTPAAGAKTYNVGLKASAGTGTVQASATSPCFLLVEAI